MTRRICLIRSGIFVLLDPNEVERAGKAGRARHKNHKQHEPLARGDTIRSYMCLLQLTDAI